MDRSRERDARVRGTTSSRRHPLDARDEAGAGLDEVTVKDKCSFRAKNVIKKNGHKFKNFGVYAKPKEMRGDEPTPPRMENNSARTLAHEGFQHNRGGVDDLPPPLPVVHGDDLTFAATESE